MRIRKSIVAVTAVAIIATTTAPIPTPTSFVNPTSQTVCAKSNVKKIKYCTEKQKKEIYQTLVDEGYSVEGCAVLMSMIDVSSNFSCSDNACGYGLCGWQKSMRKKCMKYVRKSSDKKHIAQTKYMIKQLKYTKTDAVLRGELASDTRDMVERLVDNFCKPTKNYREIFINNMIDHVMNDYMDYIDYLNEFTYSSDYVTCSE